MKGNPALKLLRLSLFSVAWLACSTFLGAQQNSGVMTSSGSAPASAASPMTGVYSIESGGMNRESAFANRFGSTASDQTEKFNYPSTRKSGEISSGGANSATWVAGEANFRQRSGSSWIAGAGNFRLAHQQGGIWRLRPGSQVQPNTSVELNDLSVPPGMTLKGAALLKGAGLSPSFSAHPAKTFGIRGFAAPRAAASSSAHAPRTSDFRTGIDVNSTQLTPSFATISGTSLQDNSNLDENLPSLDPHELGSEGAIGDTSH